MKDHYLKINVVNFTDEEIEKIKTKAQLYPNLQLLINIPNTSYITLSDVRKLDEQIGSNKVRIRVEGGYTEERIRHYQRTTYVDMHKYDNIYTLNEMRGILKEINKIEAGINSSWSPEQKLIYFIGYLKNKIIYHPFHENAPSYEIRSLRGLISHRTVCAGYALILKELCDRNGITCEYVEGVCKKEDLSKNILTHAWNIVRLMGVNIPIDLTWNAGNNKSGKTLSIEDLANVNEFVKAHFPGPFERIQDYEHELKSIDGRYLRSINNLINKDMTYDSSCMRCQRDDGEEFLVTQVEERVIDNEMLYTYIYSVLRKDGSIGESLIFYSKTNVASIVSMIHRKQKLERKLADAKRHNDTQKIMKLEKALKGSEYLEEANHAVDNLLFSRANMEAAIKRRDFYLGRIKVSKEAPKKVEGVYVDTNFAKKIEKNSRLYFRKNGTCFILEDWRYLLLSDGSKVYRYKMYEFVNIDGKMVLKKNTIYSDEELLNDRRKELADDFLARDRIDRKLKESGGYLGYYSKEGVRTYNPHINRIFSTSIYENFRMKKEHIRDYYKDLSFDDMKRMVKTYDIVEENGQEVVVTQQSRRKVTDEVLILQVKFSHIWLASAGIKWMSSDPKPGYSYAFDVNGAEKIFDLICSCINDSINKYGIIDSVAILNDVLNKCGDYKYAYDIVVAMFGNKERIEVIRQLFMLQNPSSYKVNDSFSIPLVNERNAQSLLDKRRKELEIIKRQVLEVIKQGDEVVVTQRRK